MNRRHFLASAIASSLPAFGEERRRPLRIVLRSSWQTVNIGDIGHTPGMLHLLEQYLPNVQVCLWPSSVDNGVAELLEKRFPNLTIFKEDAQKRAFEEGDFLLHGSGASLVAEKHVERWWKETGKPFGIAGITLPTAGAKTIEILNAARFVYFRDSVSLQVAKDGGCKCPVMEFGPDGAFAVDLRNESAATAFLKAHDLEEGKFLCCIPRLRNTPYWWIKKDRPFDEAKNARNEEMKEHDHAPLREAIIAVIRQTPMKILLCPEDQTQMKVGKEMIYDKLPEDVKAKVVWRENYWLTDEAVSTYVRSAGLFGNEMHSPIMCIGNGIPAIVCRWKEQTSKGIMWRDIGLGEWLFDLDNEDEVKKVAPAVLAMAQDPAAAKAKAVKAGEFVKQRQKAMMTTLTKTLG